MHKKLGNKNGMAKQQKAKFLSRDEVIAQLDNSDCEDSDNFMSGSDEDFSDCDSGEEMEKYKADGKHKKGRSGCMRSGVCCVCVQCVCMCIMGV